MDTKAILSYIKNYSEFCLNPSRIMHIIKAYPSPLGPLSNIGIIYIKMKNIVNPHNTHT